MSVKLYTLNKGTRFKLAEEATIPPDALEGCRDSVYRYTHVDGMYAPVIDEKGQRHYFAVWTEVEVV